MSSVRSDIATKPAGLCLGSACKLLRVEEADHFSRSVWPTNVGERSGRAPARPCVTSSMQHPLFDNALVGSIGIDGVAVRVASRGHTICTLARKPCPSERTAMACWTIAAAFWAFTV